MYTLGFEYRTKPLFFGRAAEDRLLQCLGAFQMRACSKNSSQPALAFDRSMTVLLAEPLRGHAREDAGAHNVATRGRARDAAPLGGGGLCPWLRAQVAQALDSKDPFVPDKTCERYLLEDCSTLHSCAGWLPMLVMESRKLALAIIKRGKNRGLTGEQTLALVVYTADLRQFGASAQHNLYHGINTALISAQSTAARGQVQDKIRGYLHFFFQSLMLLPREREGWTYRGITRTAFDASEAQYHQGAVVRWQGIVSTSKDKEVAMRFSAKGVLMRIWMSSGVSIEDFSWFEKGECEVILGPDVCFVVARGLYTDASDVATIDLVQVPGHGEAGQPEHGRVGA